MMKARHSLSAACLVLVSLVCHHALANKFDSVSGSCTVWGDCISSPNYPGNYNNGGDCTFTTTVPGILSTSAFNTESCCDNLNLRRRGSTYKGASGPSNVYLDSGSEIGWDADTSYTRSGWELCLTETTAAPTTTPTRLTTTGYCTLSSSGNCVSSPNYPSNYDSSDCTITNVEAGYLSATNFSTESSYDNLDIRRRGTGAYSGRRRSHSVSNVIQNVYLGAGETIVWTADTSGADYGWQICNSANETISTTAPTSSSSSGCCSVADLNTSTCYAYTGSCGALFTETSCWSGGECYAYSSDDCCDIDGGAIAGIVIGALVCIACAIGASCFFCSSCPLARNKAKAVIHVQQIQPPPQQQQQQQPQPVVQPVVQPPSCHPVQPPTAVPMAAKPFAMVAHPANNAPVPPAPQPAQPGVTYANAASPPPYAPRDAPLAPVAVPTPNGPSPAFCGACGAPNTAGGAFCASCGAPF